MHLILTLNLITYPCSGRCDGASALRSAAAARTRVEAGVVLERRHRRSDRVEGAPPRLQHLRQVRGDITQIQQSLGRGGTGSEHTQFCVWPHKSQACCLAQHAPFPHLDARLQRVLQPRLCCVDPLCVVAVDHAGTACVGAHANHQGRLRLRTGCRHSGAACACAQAPPRVPWCAPCSASAQEPSLGFCGLWESMNSWFAQVDLPHSHVARPDPLE